MMYERTHQEGESRSTINTIQSTKVCPYHPTIYYMLHDTNKSALQLSDHSFRKTYLLHSMLNKEHQDPEAAKEEI